MEGVELVFVLPRPENISYDFMRIIFALDKGHMLRPITYTTAMLYRKLLPSGQPYLDNLFAEVQAYAQEAARIGRQEQFDIIHAHDWLTFGAGLAAQEVSKKPLITHVHATEFDRTGHLQVNQTVYDIEKEGMQKARKVIAVSNLTKDLITHQYAIPAEKIHVVHNGIERSFEGNIGDVLPALKKNYKIVLFVGRLTLQKGPDYFLKAAQRVLAFDPRVLFILVGSGDMKEQLVAEVARLRISNNVLFAGFLRDENLQAMYKAADLFVMPSVSEPFGITGLESAINGTPVLVSKQSGVSEVLLHALKVDFWDIDEMTNKILSVLHHNPLQQTLKNNSYQEAQQLQWKHAAQKVKKLYEKALAM